MLAPFDSITCSQRLHKALMKIGERKKKGIPEASKINGRFDRQDCLSVIIGPQIAQLLSDSTLTTFTACISSINRRDDLDIQPWRG